MVWITWLCSSVVCFLNLNVLVAVSKGMQAIKLSSVKKLFLMWDCRLIQIQLYNGP